MIDLDWRTETTRKGTVSRVGQWVRGDCACGAKDELVYDSWDDETLMCADCSRRRSLANPRKELCDGCGSQDAWRDPLTRRNEFFCAVCHAGNGTVFQNRWAEKARESKELGKRAKAVCAAAGYGTDCKGEKKWRSELNKILCNGHAGKKSNGPEWHQ